MFRGIVAEIEAFGKLVRTVVVTGICLFILFVTATHPGTPPVPAAKPCTPQQCPYPGTHKVVKNHG
jgi:hypothetical protein